MTTFELIEPIEVGNQKIQTLIIGTEGKDVITGSINSEILAGGEGKNKLKGGGGADGFLFQAAESFSRKTKDTIVDFDALEGDEILIDKSGFGINKKLRFESVNGKKSVNIEAESHHDFVYDDKKGVLYFNENGKEEGWGDGGLFVKLKGSPELGADSFGLM